MTLGEKQPTGLAVLGIEPPTSSFARCVSRGELRTAPATHREERGGWLLTASEDDELPADFRR
ncbi:MAG: hypothetical protein ACRDRP_01950 [Pseudonocardiaceae bacterium]